MTEKLDLKEEILLKIKNNGEYLTPNRFLDDHYYTPLHEALNDLLKEGRIYLAKSESPYGGFQAWKERMR